MGSWFYSIATVFATWVIFFAETEASWQSPAQSQLQSHQHPSSLFELLCPTSAATGSVGVQDGHQSTTEELLTTAVQHLIELHQNPEPGQCRDKPVVVWPDPVGNRHLNFVKRTGVGGQMSQMITAFGYALAVGAIFTIAPLSTQYAPKLDCPESSLQCFLQPLSSCTSADANGKSLQNFSRNFPHAYQYGIHDKPTLSFMYNRLSEMFNSTSMFHIHRELVRYVMRPSPLMCEHWARYRPEWSSSDTQSEPASPKAKVSPAPEPPPTALQDFNFDPKASTDHRLRGLHAKDDDDDDNDANSGTTEFVAIHFRLGDKLGNQRALLRTTSAAYTYLLRDINSRLSLRRARLQYLRSFSHHNGDELARTTAEVAQLAQVSQRVLWSSDTRDALGEFRKDLDAMDKPPPQPLVAMMGFNFTVSGAVAAVEMEKLRANRHTNDENWALMATIYSMGEATAVIDRWDSNWGRLIFFLMSIKSDALARPLPTFVDVFNVVGQLASDYSRGTVAIVQVVQSNASGVITMTGTKGIIGTPPHTSMFTVVVEPEVVFGNGKDNFWTAFGTRNALVYCCGGAKHGEEDSSTQTAASAAASAAAAVIAPTTADGTPKSCAEAEIVQRSLQKEPHYALFYFPAHNEGECRAQCFHTRCQSFLYWAHNAESSNGAVLHFKDPRCLLMYRSAARWPGVGGAHQGGQNALALRHSEVCRNHYVLADHDPWQRSQKYQFHDVRYRPCTSADFRAAQVETARQVSDARAEVAAALKMTAGTNSQSNARQDVQVLAAKERVLVAEATSAAVKEAAVALRRAQGTTHVRNGTLVHADARAGNARRHLDAAEDDDDIVEAAAAAGLGIMWDWKKNGQHVFVLRRSEVELSGKTCWRYTHTLPETLEKCHLPLTSFCPPVT